MSIGRKKFNMDPKKGIEYLIDHGLLKNTPDGEYDGGGGRGRGLKDGHDKADFIPTYSIDFFIFYYFVFRRS